MGSLLGSRAAYVVATNDTMTPASTEENGDPSQVVVA
jgi:hypothetical protein